MESGPLGITAAAPVISYCVIIVISDRKGEKVKDRIKRNVLGW